MAATLTQRSALAGSWYPDDPSELRELLSEELRTSIARTGRYVRPGGVAFLTPHAAPAYSGVVATSTYRHLQANRNIERVFVVGFSHRRLFSGVLLPDADGMETPLGVARLDREMARWLAARRPFELAPERLASDHSVEVQIPFLQTYLPGVPLVPLYVGQLTGAERREAARVLRDLVGGGRGVLVVSSDLTHYGEDFGYVPFEADPSAVDQLRRLDMGALAAAGSLDAGVFRRELRRTGATVCGAAAIELVLDTLAGLPGETFPEEIFQDTLDYQTSAELTGDCSHSVSYGAAGYFPEEAFYLAPADRRLLLEWARRGLDRFRETGEHWQAPAGAVAGALEQRGRVFATLYSGDAIRGCVGMFEHPQPLYACAAALAQEACEDTRFGGTETGEDLEIELHVLTPPRRLAALDGLQAGEHGAFLQSGDNRGLLLPVVATSYGMDRLAFLRALARKAGLAEEIYSHHGDWELSVFRDQVFREGGEEARPA